MSLSVQSISAIVDLIENKLSYMSVADRDDLREKVALQRALHELSASGAMVPSMAGVDEVPRRGRRRRMESYA